MTIYNIKTKYLKAAAIFASKEETRYYLQGVQCEIFERHITLSSTDARRLFIASCELLKKYELDHFMTKETFVIPSYAIKKALMGYKEHTITIGVNKDNEGKNITNIMVGDVVCSPVGGEFPDFRKLLDLKELSNKPAQFDAKYLVGFAKAAKILGEKRGYFDIGHNGDAPAPISFMDKSAAGILMPIGYDSNSNYKSLFEKVSSEKVAV